MDDEIKKLIMDVALRTTGCEDSVRLEQFGDERTLECDSVEIIPLGSDWLFRSATDYEAQSLLLAYLRSAEDLDIGPGLHGEFARLLSEKGSLVADQLLCLIENQDWANYGSPQLLLSGLHFLPDGKRKTMELLDVIPEDWRDGLLASIWKANDLEVNKALLRKFEEWILVPDWGPTSGEGGWMGKFIAKWLAEGTFDTKRLAAVTRWYFTNIVLPRWRYKMRDSIMISKLHDLIKAIAQRNGSIEYYPLQEFEDGGKRWLLLQSFGMRPWRNAVVS